MGGIKPAIRWFNQNCEKLGKRFKDKWLAIDRNGVQKSSTSYAVVAEFAKNGQFLLVKVPKNPDAVYFY